MSRIRRIILLAGLGLLVGLLIVTGLGAIPRPVDINVIFDDSTILGREVRTTLTSEEEIVADASERVPTAEGSANLRYRLWLAPQPHRIEVTVRGCPSLTRTFDPRDVDDLILTFRCDSELEAPRVQ